MAARAYLRRTFLSARVAVSGANFGVAETGTLAVVESEGNGRMCLTLPQTLITVMGIEKLVPTWRDLEVFLQLLPRSSTGERMNPYTSMWTGVTPGDGPQEFHLVLLDNGRTATLADEVGRSALHCIRCSACLNVCPVYERVGGHAYGSVYPGPIGAVLTPQLAADRGHDSVSSLPFASSLCGACFDACPVKIDIPQLLVHLRTRVVDDERARRRTPTAEQATMAATAWVMASPRRFRAAEGGSKAGRLVSRGWSHPQAAGSAGRLDVGARPARSPQGDLPPVVVADSRRYVVTARDDVLARIRDALGDDVAPVDVPRAYRTAGTRDRGDPALLDLLEDRLVDYRATVHRTAESGIASTVATILRERGATRIAKAPGLDIELGSDIGVLTEHEAHSIAMLDAVDGS